MYSLMIDAMFLLIFAIIYSLPLTPQQLTPLYSIYRWCQLLGGIVISFSKEVDRLWKDIVCFYSLVDDSFDAVVAAAAERGVNGDNSSEDWLRL